VPVGDEAFTDGERKPLVAAIARGDFARVDDGSDEDWGQDEHMFFGSEFL
jgi:hypothetical protein